MIDIDKLVAEPGFAPEDWQSTHPANHEQWGRQPPVTDSTDLRRIAALPYRSEIGSNPVLTALITAKFARQNSHCRCRELYKRECITSLRPVQAWALQEIAAKQGLVGPIGVGHGKTLLNIITPLAMPGCRVAVLLVPPSLTIQLMDEWRLLKEHFYVPSIERWGSGRERQRGKGGDDAPLLYLYPYSLLSRPENTSILKSLSPDTIIADECHRLRHPDTSTTSRVLRYFTENPHTRFCAWSGSLTDSSIRDYAHLSALALKDTSPLPKDPVVVQEWARAIDASDNPAPAGALLQLCKPGEHIQDAFHRRLVETQGVVATSEPAIPAKLDIQERKVDYIPEQVKEALRDLRATWTRPDGEELVDALSLNACARQLACGFYYRWIFPRGEHIAMILEWLAARKEWHKELREKLKKRQEHLDSPFLCAQAARRYYGEISNEHDLPVWQAETWQRWQRIKSEVQPETEAVRIDPYLAQDAAEWGKENRGIIWTKHSAFGVWVAELSGLPFHTGGPNAGALLKAEKGDRSIIASIDSHGTGRDGLQRIFQTQLVANPPSTPTAWEQMLGRLHRIGQKAPTVTAWFYKHTQEMKDLVDTALMRTLYVEKTLGSKQKLSALRT